MPGGWKSYEDEAAIRIHRALSVNDIDSIVAEARDVYRDKPALSWALQQVEQAAERRKRAFQATETLISVLDLPEL